MAKTKKVKAPKAKKPTLAMRVAQLEEACSQLASIVQFHHQVFQQAAEAHEATLRGALGGEVVEEGRSADEVT